MLRRAATLLAAIGVILGVGISANPAGASGNSFTGSCSIASFEPYETVGTCTGLLNGGKIATYPFADVLTSQSTTSFGPFLDIFRDTHTITIGTASISYSLIQEQLLVPPYLNAGSFILGNGGGFGYSDNIGTPVWYFIDLTG